MDILKTKAMLNSALSIIRKEDKNTPSIYSALKAPTLNRNDSLNSVESKVENYLQINYMQN